MTRMIDVDLLIAEFEKVYPLATNEMGGVVNKRIYDIINSIPVVAGHIPYNPVGDCISRNAVIRMFNTMDRYKADKLILQDTDKEFPKNEVFIVDDCYEQLDLIDNAPPAPDRPQGRWIPQGGGFSWVFKCSCCSWVDGYPLNERHKYCPNCGAQMLKGGTE